MPRGRQTKPTNINSNPNGEPGPQGPTPPMKLKGNDAMPITVVRRGPAPYRIHVSPNHCSSLGGLSTDNSLPRDPESTADRQQLSVRCFACLRDSLPEGINPLAQPLTVLEDQRATLRQERRRGRE